MLWYFFPPIGGGGTPRSVEFVKHLPQFGYRPTVVTAQPVEGTFEREFQSDGEAWEELSDSSFDLPRVPDPEAPALGDRLEKWRVFSPCPGLGLSLVPRKSRFVGQASGTRTGPKGP